MLRNALCALATLAILAGPALADPDAFAPGPLIPDYGPVAAVDGAEAIPPDTVFRISFDTRTQADAGELNSTLTGAARFLNMHTAAGVPAENINLAVVVHGAAVHDVTTGEAGANADLVEALVGHGVKIYVCGQSAVWYGVSADDLLPGVALSLSAMTAHALLQQQGYTLNPF